MNADIRLEVKPEADTRTVEDLVAQVRRGLVRIPTFQRDLRWEAKDVLALFDSVYRGYPIGSLLLRKGPAEAAQLHQGPLTIDAPETREALWVVDGQQRLTALAAGLLHPRPIPARPVLKDPFIVFFDASERVFHEPPTTGIVPSTWVPVAELLDASALIEWVFHWEHASDAALRSSVFDASTRVRQYSIPLYVVATDDGELGERLLKEIFYRVNNHGHSLKWDEVHDALFGRPGDQPSTLLDLAKELELLGMGRPGKEQLLTCLLAFKGLDVTRNLAEHYGKDQDLLRTAVSEALPAMRRVLSFLRTKAQIPHLRLLPRSIPLVVLTRFFALYEEPNTRTTDLLTRWTWRTLLRGSAFDERTLLRHGVTTVEGGDEEAAVQHLLSLVPRERQGEFFLPKRFDARAAESRIALVGMASLKPINPLADSPVDVASEIRNRDVDAFRRIWPGDERIAQSPANRILLPGRGSARKDLQDLIEVSGRDAHLLASHGISEEGARALVEGDMEAFLSNRTLILEATVQRLGTRLAAWERSDRPSLQYVLDSASEFV